MDKREKSIIGSNLDGLVDQTICNNQLLTKLQACNILSADDVEELNILENRFKRSRALYNIIQTRDRGFSELVKALKDTNQSGAVNILLTGKLKRESVGLESLHTIKYDISSELLGKGLHGKVVYKARWTDRQVAIKRVNAFNDIEKNCIANEIENLRECDSHENIIRFFAAIEKPNFKFVYVVLELCDMTLKQWIGNQSSIQIQQREVLRQITLGLEFVHSKNILLLGMKPENVLLTRNPSKVKISGFGLSTRVHNSQEGCNVTKLTVVETLGFDAPEFEAPAINDDFNSQHICTFASDVYSLGCMYFYVLTSGTNDFGDLKSMENVDTDLKDIVTNEIDAQTAKDFLLIQNMISHNPTTRPSCTYLLLQPTVKSSSLKAEPNANNSTPLLSFIKKIKHKRWKDKLALSKLYEDNENLRTKITELVASCSFQSEQQHVQEQESAIEIVTEEFISPNKNNQSQIQQKAEVQKKLDMGINKQMTYHKQVTPSTSSTCSNIEIVKVRAPIIKQPQTSHNKVETQEDAASSGSCKKLEELYKLGFKSIPNICNTEVVKVHTSIIKQVQTQEDRLVGKNSPFINKNRIETYENKVSSGSCKTLEELHKMDLYDKPGRIFEIVKTENLRTIKNALKSVEQEMNLSKLFDVKLKSLVHVAIEYQDYSVVKFLAKRYVFSDLFSQYSFKKSLVRLCMNDMHKLLPAKLEQKCKILNLLFKLQLELVNTRDEHGWTPLHLATMHAYRNNQLQYDLVNMLLRKNASINMQDNHNSTPLHMAVSFQVPDSSIIKLLIANGANPDVKFFQLLIDNGNPEVFHEVVVHLVSLGKDNLLTGHVAIGDTETVLSYAVLKFDVLKHTLKIFKSLGFNFKNYRLKSLLHVAIKGGRQGPFLKTLIKLGAEYKLACLLHYCVQHSNLSALKIFISLGCDLNEKDCNRSTPLQIARSKNLQEIVKELVKHGSSM